jgi:hypothetical protein
VIFLISDSRVARITGMATSTWLFLWHS